MKITCLSHIVVLSRSDNWAPQFRLKIYPFDSANYHHFLKPKPQKCPAMFGEEEITQTYKEYRTYFPEIEIVWAECPKTASVVSTNPRRFTLVKESLDDKDDLVQSLRLSTLENDKFLVFVTEQGWHYKVINNNTQSEYAGKMFETFESLAMSVSPGFQRQWHSTLMSRLEQLK